MEELAALHLKSQENAEHAKGEDGIVLLEKAGTRKKIAVIVVEQAKINQAERTLRALLNQAV